MENNERKGQYDVTNAARKAAFDTDAHWHTRVPAPPAPVNTFSTKLWVRVLSVCLSLLLAVTMFDATALVSYADELTDEAAPLASTGGTTESTAPDTSWAAALQGQALDEAVLTSLVPAGLIPASDVLPQVTADSEGVAEEDRVDLTGRVRPHLVMSGVPYSASQGLFLKNARAQASFELGNRGLLLEGGTLAGSKAGDRFVFTMDVPYLYTNDSGDVAATYSQEEWKLRTALANEAAKATSGAPDAAASEREAREAAADAALSAETVASAPRVALFADGLPEGWSLWQEHAGSYRALTDEDLQAGVSGRLIWRYDANDGKLDAAAALPAFEVGFAGSVPAGTLVPIYYGYEMHSFTARAVEGEEAPLPQYGDAKRAAVGSYQVSNEESDAAAALTVTPQAALMPRTAFADGTGYAVHLVRYEVPADAPAATAIALGAAFPADYAGAGGVTDAVLMAHQADEDGNPLTAEEAAAAAAADDSQDATYVGVPGKGGVLVLDVTGLSEQQIAAINPMKASSLEALGLKPLPYTVTDDSRIQLARTGDDGRIEPGQARQLYVAAPYTEAAVTFVAPEPAEDADAAAAAEAEAAPEQTLPVHAQFDVQLSTAGVGESVVYAECFNTDTVFTETAMGDAFMTDEQVEAAQGEQAEKPQPTLPGLEAPGSALTPGGPRPSDGVGDANEADAPDDDGAEAEADRAETEKAEVPEGYRDADNAPNLLLDAEAGGSLLRSRVCSAAVPFASQLYQLPSDYLDPHLHISGGTAVDGMTNANMIKSQEIIEVTLMPNPTKKTGFLGKHESLSLIHI